MPIFVEGRNFAAGEILGDRKGQEDFHAYLLLNEGQELLAILADGMGGHEAGEVASRLAVESFARCFERHSAGSVSAKLGAALEAADNALAQHVKANPSVRGMGCTLVAAHFSSNEVHWISVGDSPLYILRKGRLSQINEDHSMAPEIEKSLKAGKITASEAQNHPHRNALRSALMGEGTPKLIDSPGRPMKLKGGDVIIVASDGLQTLTDPEIGKVIQSDAIKLASQGVQRLLRAVEKKQKRNQDNATVQMVCLPSSAGRQTSYRKWLIIALCLAAISTAAILFAFLAPIKSSDMSVWLSQSADQNNGSGIGSDGASSLVPEPSTSDTQSKVNRPSAPSDKNQAPMGSMQVNDDSKDQNVAGSEKGSSDTIAKPRDEANKLDDKALPLNEKPSSDGPPSKKASVVGKSSDSQGEAKGPSIKK